MKRYAPVLVFLVFLAICAACNDEDKVTPAPEIYFSSSGSYEIAIDDTLTLSPRITYDYNSTYTWLRNGEVVSNELEYVFIPDRMQDYAMTFMVENDNGSDTASVSIAVLKNIDFSSFENLTISKKAALVLLPDSAEGFIVDTTAVLSNAFNADTTMWYGFAFSSKTTITTSSISSSSIGTAYTSSTTSSSYMCLNCNNSDCMPIVTFNRAYQPLTVDVANDNYSFLVSRYGVELLLTDSTTYTIPYMNTGDYLILAVSGLDANGSVTSTLQYPLIDCRTDNSSHFSRVNDWTTIDISALGPVSGLYFDMLCSRGTFPLFACIDNLKLQDE